MSPTATTWAKYQVEPSEAAYQRAEPAPMKAVRAFRTEGRTASRPNSQYTRATSKAPMRMASDVWSTASPQSATKGRRTIAGRGGKGIVPRPVAAPVASVTGVTSLKKALPGPSAEGGTG